jgi:hypothetical protein
MNDSKTYPQSNTVDKDLEKSADSFVHHEEMVTYEVPAGAKEESA